MDSGLLSLLDVQGGKVSQGTFVEGRVIRRPSVNTKPLQNSNL